MNNINDIMKRANTFVISDFDEDDLYTTWIISRSNKPITREESYLVLDCFKNSRVVFIPEPKDSIKPDVKYTIYDLKEMDVVKTRGGKVYWVLKDKYGELCIVDNDNNSYNLNIYFHKDFCHKRSISSDEDKDIVEISFLSSNPSRAIPLMAELRKATEKDIKEKCDEIQREFNWIKVLD